MKLFICINFDEESKEKLYRHMQVLTQRCESGSFSKKENIHLTLVYIGETTQIGSIVETMDSIDAEQFEIMLSDKGNFKRSGGDIYWCGIEKTPELIRLQKILYRSLSRHGVMTDKNEFKPHLTVSRDTVIDKNDVPTVDFSDSICVKRVSLMKCEPGREGLSYTEVYAKELRERSTGESAPMFDAKA